jgi:hypothetical protein
VAAINVAAIFFIFAIAIALISIPVKSKRTVYRGTLTFTFGVIEEVVIRADLWNTDTAAKLLIPDKVWTLISTILIISQADTFA